MDLDEIIFYLQTIQSRTASQAWRSTPAHPDRACAEVQERAPQE
jgi:hypothetical protein